MTRRRPVTSLRLSRTGWWRRASTRLRGLFGLRLGTGYRWMLVDYTERAREPSLGMMGELLGWEW